MQSAFQSVSMASVMGANFDVHAPHYVSISITGSKHIIKVDGVDSVQLYRQRLTSGYAGVRTWNNPQVEDNVTITKN
ncbi:hypothetical protein SDC9_130000 [bioreactor metagenome]|uniref:Uncharacterized protein n=1 Tax=bioreactor metagenome TaxID=1076179 RepID=A0A645D1E9_9ZZZZ